MSRPPNGRSIPTPPGSPPGRPSNLHVGNGSAVAHVSSPTSPRSSFLGSFMRTRTRAQSVTNAVAGAVRGRVGSPTVESPNPMNNVAGDGHGATRSTSTPPAAAEPVNLPPIDPSLRRTHRVRLVPVLENNRSFSFAPILREMGVMHVPPGILPSIAASSVADPGPTVNGRQPPLLLKIGRFTDRTVAAAAAAAAGGDASAGGTAGGAPGNPSAAITGGGGGELLSSRAAFKSKVVSRSHAEIWCEPGGKFYIRDTASSSGTFLNHIRLSSPNVPSRPQMLKDGDVLQLGVDYQGGAEEMYRCVKMRVEIGREWQRGANEFNTNALKQLKALSPGPASVPSALEKVAAASSSRKQSKSSVTDCCICLFSVTVCQSLFIAPCSHVFHYKCIRPLLTQHYPGFSCPLCRTFANLEEDVETEDAWEIASRRQSVISRRNSNHSLRHPNATESATPPLSNPATAVPPLTPTAADGSLSLGDLPAGIEALLATPTNRVSEDSSHASTSNGQPAQNTTTPTATAAATASPAAVTTLPAAGTHSRAAAAPVTINDPATPERSSTEAGFSAAASLAQTPMNDVFLSTLVLDPSRHGADSGCASGTGSIATSGISHEIAEDPAAEAAAARDDDEVVGGMEMGVAV